MRLICPNCGAQYEVPSNVIPADGRDVQCSNCTHTWYQTAPLDRNAAAHRDDWDHESDDSDAGPPPDVDPARKARSIDPSVLEVLREEAEREARQRAAESSALETQPNLGLVDPEDDDTARRAHEPQAPAPAETPDTPPADTRPDSPRPAPGSRRELLPDIEEINQSLRAAPLGAAGADRDMSTPLGRAAQRDEEAAQRSGFSAGFRFSVLLALLAIALYAFGSPLIDAVPALDPVITPYLEVIDTGRIWLDGQVRALWQSLEGAAAQ